MKKLLGMLLTGAAVTSTVAACGGEDNTLVIAALPSEVLNGETHEELIQTVKQLGIALGRPTEIIHTTDNAAAASAVATGQADIVVGSTGTFWEAEAQNPNLKIITTVAKDGDINNAGYNAIIGTHIDNKDDITATDAAGIVTAMKGESFSFVTTTSTSGGKLPMQMFWDHTTASDYTTKTDIFNSNAYLGDVTMSQNHDTSIKNILDKQSKYGVYFEEQLAETTADAAYDVADMHVVYKTQAPGTPLWGDVTDAEMKTIQDHLVTLNPTNTPELYNIENAFNFVDETIRFVAANKDMASYITIRDIDDANDNTRTV